VGFEPTISAGEQPQTYALDRAATGTGIYIYMRTSNLHHAFLNDCTVSTIENINLSFQSNT
jgi:hypothetical protein